MLRISFKNSIDAIKMLNIIDKNIRIINKIWSEIARNIVKSSNANDQTFENKTANNNLFELKVRNIFAINKFNIRRWTCFIKIENLLNNVHRKANTTTFATINKTLIEKKKKYNRIRKFWSIHERLQFEKVFDQIFSFSQSTFCNKNTFKIINFIHELCEKEKQ